MPYEKKSGTRLTLIWSSVLLILALSATSLGQATGENDTSETHAANELVDKANAAIKTAKELQAKNEAKVGDYKAALNADDFSQAQRILGGLIQDIGTGLEHGTTAASALEQAAMLHINPVFREYLELRAQSIRERIQSYTALRSVLEFTSEMLDERTPAAIQRLIPKIREAQDTARQHDKKADSLEAQSDKIRRDNPDAFQGVTPVPTKVKGEAVPAKKTSRAAKPRKRKGKA